LELFSIGSIGPFLATYLIGAFVAVFKRKASNIEDHSDDEAD